MFFVYIINQVNWTGMWLEWYPGQTNLCVTSFSPNWIFHLFSQISPPSGVQNWTWTRSLGLQRALIQLQDTLMEPYCAELDQSEWKSSCYWTETKTRRAGGNSPSCSQWRLCPLLELKPCGVQPLLLSANHNTPSIHTQQTHKHTQLTNVSK